MASRQWWKFWQGDVWRAWWSDRQAWAAYKEQRGDLDRRSKEARAALGEAEGGIEQAARAIGWVEDLGPREVPAKTARAEVGLASVEGVTLLETRKREGKDVWTPVDRGPAHFTDRQMIFSGRKDVRFRFDHIQSVRATHEGLHVVVSSRKRSHILGGPAEQVAVLLEAASGWEEGADPAAPWREREAEHQAAAEHYRGQLAELEEERESLVAPRRPVSPAWVPGAVVLLLFLLLPGGVDDEAAVAGSEEAASPQVAVTTTTTTSTTTTTVAATTTTTEARLAAPVPEGTLVVHFIDVGQGDATLLQGPDFTVLIDAGRHDRTDVVPYLRSVGVESIDLLVGTHPHADHIGQFPEVLGAFPVEEVWMSGDLHTTLTFEAALDAIEASESGYHEPRAGESYVFGSLLVEVVHPQAIGGDLDDGSVGIRATFGEVTFLLTGDASQQAERAILGRGHDVGAHILQVGHHGSSTSSGLVFLQAVGPEVAVYSAGANNQFGHPHDEVIERLLGLGIAVYGTDVHGTIRVITDGATYTVETERAGEIQAPSATTTTTVAEESGCAPGQVDINSAGFEELQRIIHIGPDRAQQILDLRPFFSVDSMDRISGIGPARLADIKAQGVACVP